MRSWAGVPRGTSEGERDRERQGGGCQRDVRELQETQTRERREWDKGKKSGMGETTKALAADGSDVATAPVSDAGVGRPAFARQ